jgi:hypothetical protein
MPNLATYFVDTTKRRTTEVPKANWVDGMNLGGSNAPGIGINTGGYDPKLTDWPNQTFGNATVPADPIPYFGESSHIGLVAGINNRLNVVVTPADTNDQLEFVVTAAAVAPGAPLIAGVVNRTGVTVPSGARAWGTVTVA